MRFALQIRGQEQMISAKKIELPHVGTYTPAELPQLARALGEYDVSFLIVGHRIINTQAIDMIAVDGND